MARVDVCTEVTPECPVSATIYGYEPNLAANALFCAIFGVCGVLQLLFGIRYRTWTWTVGLSIGCLLEMAGYIGRLLLHQNPWNQAGFKLQIVALIMAPSCITAGIDLTMKYIALTFGEEWSRLRPRLYTWLFISLDILSILVQGAGGGLAAGGEDSESLLQTGNDVIMAGIALQIFQLAVLGVLALEYGVRVFRHRQQLSPARLAYAHSFKFRAFLAAITLSYLTILTRCIYRMPEMAQGWGKGLQRDEPKFLVLDGAMVCIAAIALTVFHPGIFFPQLSKGNQRKNVLSDYDETKEEDNTDDSA